MLELSGLRKSFSGFVAVSDVSLRVEALQIAAIIGPNGAGKSTLFNLITGLLRPDSGQGLVTVMVAGREWGSDGWSFMLLRRHSATAPPLPLGRSAALIMPVKLHYSIERAPSSFKQATALTAPSIDRNRPAW
jgi:ABC-type nitrate/sulfonate/bicarbonate transport system ATPase subunit